MADSFDKFSIGIDADVSALQSSLKAAQNTLAQFEGALKKATNIGEINYLSKNIDNLKGKITQLNQRASGLGRPMGDATQSLINFSRIAQDAPYGIIGVANNLNPMLESFQRLAKTEGGTKKALQAMSAGLIGPAGVGVALGIVSSLAVTFSKEIKEFFKGPTSELEEFRKQLKEVADDIYKLIGGEQTKRTKGIILAELIVGGNKTQQEEALKELQKLYSNSTAIKNAKLGEDKAFYQTLVNQAAMQGDAVAKEKNNLAQLDIAYADNIKNENKRNEELKKITSEKLEGTGFATRRVSITEQKNRINAQYDILGNEIKKNIANLELNTLEQLKTITLTPTADNVKKGGTKTIDALKEFSANLKYELAQQLMDIERYKKIFKDKGFDNALILTYGDKGEAAQRKKRMGEETKRVTGKDNSLGNFLGKDAKQREKEWAIEKEKVDNTAKAYENFANMLAGNVTSGLMSVWDALEQGTNPLDAIGQMFLNIAKSIAAAIIQATIFEAILTAFPELKAIFRASGALQSAFGYSGPRAAGGITNGPSMALIGEAGPEAVIPLSKLSGMLNTTFSAGAMSGGGGMSGGSFVLRGQDLLVAINRTQKSSFLKGQNISLV
jgi:hypothetical protein